MQPASRCRDGVLRLIAVLLAFGYILGAETAAQQPGNSEKKNPTSSPGTPAVPSKGLEGLKLPSDAVIVVFEQAADALRQLPRFVMISPEKLKELQDEIERLKAKPRAEKPVAPSLLHIEGRIEGETVRLDVRYEFETERPGSLLALGCKQAHLTRASLDGRTPLIRPTENEGYVALIENKGKAHLTAQYSLALTATGPTGATRALDLDLPPAAGTTIKLHLPAEIKDLRVNERALDNPLLTWRNGLLEGSHDPGPANRLLVTWKGSSAAPGGPTVLAAEGRIAIRVNEQRQVTTEARLHLKVLGGQTDVWKLLVPLHARVELAAADQERIKIETQDLPSASVCTLRLAEASSEPLTVTVHAPTRLLAPRPAAPMKIGLFAVLGARQSGSGVISSAAGNLQLFPHYPAAGTVTPQPLTPEELKLGSHVQAFRYDLPVLADAAASVDKNESLTLLDLEAQAVQGRVEARVTHTFRLPRKENPADRRHWMVQTTIDARLVQPGVKQLEWQLPPECTYVAADQRLPEPVLSIGRTDRDRRIILPLTDDSWKTFQINLRARYDRPIEDRGAEALPLPKVIGAIPGGFQINVAVPEDLELLPPQQASSLLEMSQNTPQEQLWRPDPAADRSAEQIDLAWRPYRPEVDAESTVDLDLQSGQGMVRQELLLRSAGAAPTRVTLRLPHKVDNLKCVAGGKLLAEEVAGSAVRWIEPTPARISKQECRLVLNYSFGLPDAMAGNAKKAGEQGEGLAIPLIWVESATQTSTTVRIWTEAGQFPTLAAEGWTKLNLVAEKDHARLPILVLGSLHGAPVLKLDLGHRAESPTSTVLLERALIRVSVQENVGQMYRASFRISNLSPPENLVVEMPAPIAQLNMKVRLLNPNHPAQEITPGILRESDERVAVLPLRGLLKTKSILEISYELPPSGLDAPASRLLQTVLQPPVLRGEPGHVLTRWQVSLPPGWVVLGPEGGPGSERVWERRNWLMAPRLKQTSADLDSWLYGPDGVPTGEEAEPESVPSLVCWRGALEPMMVIRVPQQGWLLICSLLVLVLGLGTWLLCRKEEQRSYRFGRVWLAASVVALLLVIASVFWPTVMTEVAYGSQPGLVVLILAGAVGLVVQERRRRQLVFLPSFTRTRGSSLLRNKPASAPRARSHGEPSTVDAPRPT